MKTKNLRSVLLLSLIGCWAVDACATNTLRTLTPCNLFTTIFDYSIEHGEIDVDDIGSGRSKVVFCPRQKFQQIMIGNLPCEINAKSLIGLPHCSKVHNDGNKDVPFYWDPTTKLYFKLRDVYVEDPIQSKEIWIERAVKTPKGGIKATRCIYEEIPGVMPKFSQNAVTLEVAQVYQYLIDNFVAKQKVENKQIPLQIEHAGFIFSEDRLACAQVVKLSRIVDDVSAKVLELTGPMGGQYKGCYRTPKEYPIMGKRLTRIQTDKIAHRSFFLVQRYVIPTGCYALKSEEVKEINLCVEKVWQDDRLLGISSPAKEGITFFSWHLAGTLVRELTYETLSAEDGTSETYASPESRSVLLGFRRDWKDEREGE